jgi:hypothetical protein
MWDVGWVAFGRHVKAKMDVQSCGLPACLTSLMRLKLKYGIVRRQSMLVSLYPVSQWWEG